jgi:hypothetical protein
VKQWQKPTKRGIIMKTNTSKDCIPKNCACLFLSGMDERQRRKFKTMLEKGHVSTHHVSKAYCVENQAFHDELKAQA